MRSMDRESEYPFAKAQSANALKSFAHSLQIASRAYVRLCPTHGRSTRASMLDYFVIYLVCDRPCFMHLSRFRTALMQPQALTFPFLSLLVLTVTTFPQSHLHTVVEQRCFVPLPLRTETFGFPGPITTRCPNLVPGSSCMSSFRPRPILMFISLPLNVDRRPAGTEPCARTQMPAGRLKELIVSFCGGSDPRRRRWRRTYYTIKFGGAGVEPVLCLTFASGHVTPFHVSALGRTGVVGAWAVDRVAAASH